MKTHLIAALLIAAIILSATASRAQTNLGIEIGWQRNAQFVDSIPYSFPSPSNVGFAFSFTHQGQSSWGYKVFTTGQSLSLLPDDTLYNLLQNDLGLLGAGIGFRNVAQLTPSLPVSAFVYLGPQIGGSFRDVYWQTDQNAGKAERNFRLYYGFFADFGVALHSNLTKEPWLGLGFRKGAACSKGIITNSDFLYADINVYFGMKK